MTTIASVRGLDTLSGEMLNALAGTAYSIGVDPDWLAAIISFETARTFDPGKRNKASGAVGLIQFLPSTIRMLAQKGIFPADMTADKMADQSFMNQLDYVEAYYKWVHPSGKLKTLDDAYMVVFHPAAVGQPPDYVIGQRDADDPALKRRYDQNSYLDTGDTGYVLKRDAAKQVKGVLAYAQNEPRTEVPTAVAGVFGDGGRGGSGFFHFLVVGGVGYGLYRAWRNRG